MDNQRVNSNSQRLVETPVLNKYLLIVFVIPITFAFAFGREVNVIDYVMPNYISHNSTTFWNVESDRDTSKLRALIINDPETLKKFPNIKTQVGDNTIEKYSVSIDYVNNNKWLIHKKGNSDILSEIVVCVNSYIYRVNDMAKTIIVDNNEPHRGFYELPIFYNMYFIMFPVGLFYEGDHSDDQRLQFISPIKSEFWVSRKTKKILHLRLPVYQTGSLTTISSSNDDINDKSFVYDVKSQHDSKKSDLIQKWVMTENKSIDDNKVKLIENFRLKRGYLVHFKADNKDYTINSDDLLADPTFNP